MPTIFPGVGEISVSQYSPTRIPFQIGYNAPSGTYTVPVPAGTMVTDVVVVVKQVCDQNPTLKIGDGDDDDGYLTSANIAPGTALTVTTPAVHHSEGIANPYQFGKYYPTADTVDFVWVKGAAATTGQIVGYVEVSNFVNGGQSAGLTA